MKTTYIAKTKHSVACPLCEDAIMPGDKVKGWSWWNFEGYGVKFGGYTRVHWTCNEIASRDGLCDETLRTFEEIDEDRHNNCDEPEEHKYVAEAAKKLVEWREANPTNEYLLFRAIELLTAALPIIKPDAPLRHYKNDAVRDEVRKFLKRFTKKEG